MSPHQVSPSLYQATKCFVTYGSMAQVDPKQTPKRGKPWATFLSQDFIHKVELIVPKECYEDIRKRLVEDKMAPIYYRVTMPLAQVFEMNFFTDYIKRGNVLMRSEGNIAIDNLFTLREGVLTMFLDRETYERAGLVGKPYGTGASQRSKQRWVVSYNLRSPSMVHGKKGFDRLLYACRNVLNQPLTWLLCNANKSAPYPDLLAGNFPTRFTSSPGVSLSIEAIDPSMTLLQDILDGSDRTSLEETATDLYEWLSLIRLGSPRVLANDTIDPYLSRYSPPGDSTDQIQVCRISWQGFISVGWVRDILVDILVGSSSNHWFFLSSTAHPSSITGSCNEVAFLRPDKCPGKYLMWEVKGSA